MIYVVINLLCFSLIFFLGKDAGDAMVGFQSIILVGEYILVLFNYRKKYISKYFIIFSACSCVSQILIYDFLERMKIFNINSGPLSGGEFALLFYYAILIFFNILLWITNIVKFIICKFSR